ncbi:MAG: MBOAT family O-acyltransferase [Gemmataceae bacterium]
MRTWRSSTDGRTLKAMLLANAAAATPNHARWAAEWPYFQWLHRQLPEPFFQTQGFLVFCLLILALYWAIPRRLNSLRVVLLVIASFHFYAAWNASLAFLVTMTAVLDYCFARGMDRARDPVQRRALLIVSISMNLGILAYFKYRGFFLNELYDALTNLGVPPGFTRLNPLELIVPFGISFYTFEAISYAVDVYQKKIRAERSLPHFLLFILFFPHLVAGPIVRGGDFLRQAHRPKRWNWIRVQFGVQLFLLGLFKKLAIADRMAIFADPIFQNPTAYNSGAVWLALLAYALRIYADFSGYSDMAVGTAHLFGYKLTQNFNMPYLATNIADFWRRWHISLSSWLRDYVFIPLGGSRGTNLATYRNLLITMTLGGLWHGAHYTYIVWGLLHGCFLILHRLFRNRTADSPRYQRFAATLVGRAMGCALTFLCVALAWVFFRPEWDLALAMLRKLLWISEGLPLPLHNRSLWYTVLFVFACHCILSLGWWQIAARRAPAVAMGLGYAICLSAAMILAPDSGRSFIYFTF